MRLFVRWNGGVAVAYGDTRLILDPRRSHPAYPEVFITHAHHDHSRGLRLQRGTKYSTIQTLDLATGGRRGVVQRWREVVVNRRFRVGELEVEAHNAGHILGSVQYEIRSPEGSIVYTGDINVVDTFTTRAADIVPCDVLIIEATYGSPCRFPPRDRVIAEILQWVVKSITKDGRIPALQTDPIGNAQELIAILNRFSRVPVVTHPRITAINQIYERFGCRLNYIDARTEDAEELASSRSCVYITPKRVDLSGHPEFNVAYVSGWAPKFAGWRKPFTLSDHADFYGLLEYIQNVQPRMVYTCLGGRRMNQILARSVRKLLGIEAKPLPTTEEPIQPQTPSQNGEVEAYEREILRVVRIPGFQYGERWIRSEVSRRLREFSEASFQEALRRLTRRGVLRRLHGQEGYERR